MDISAEQVRTAIVSLIAFVLSITVHEFGHAWMANRLGDRLPAQQGRLTLSPMAHIDPIGTLLMPLLAVFAPGGFPLLAWGKPVQTNPKGYTRLSPRTGHMLVALMGPFMNLVLALAISLVLIVVGRTGILSEGIAQAAVDFFLKLNIMLMFFNLLPVPPLDGGSVLAGLLPDSLQFIPAFLQRYGMLVFFALLLSGVLKFVLRPAYHLAALWGDVVTRLMAG
ncbi:MAG TPA: site-2 protease family protein [Polyangia bacterium]|jgi:Zn-dependent protease|nr:site-2 protease family protein [Polyangia bacterium]